MFCVDWLEKFVVKVYSLFVLNDWWIKVYGKVGKFGKVVVCGFYGDYVVIVECDGKMV